MSESTDQQYMERCLQLARMAKRTARPNPMVGAVVVCDGKIIGEGYHRKCGEPHAEVNAIHSVKEKHLLKKSTIYVSLEPCSHYGKTPPCSELIIKSGIPRVVVGSLDPFPQVSGRGVRMLRQAGVEVKVGVLEKECIALNKYFMHYQQEKLPYVILKWAESKDGYIDMIREEFENAALISNNLTQTYVHKLRSEVQAILVGTDTALKDNPSLSVRYWSGQNPIRVVLDRTGRLPVNLKLFDNTAKTIIFTESKDEVASRFATKDQIQVIQIHFNKNLLKEILAELGRMSVQSLLVEGGGQLLQAFIDQRLWDKAQIETGNVILNDGVKAPVLKNAFLIDTVFYLK
ncbi:MAG: bifunctional diaminohydroxyphosphoribosylaminopyrimidine deaminase/5-amino-6-(5-phosphoribosylamino)uracil reductase RibD, partial [Bacteroidales bacterium]